MGLPEKEQKSILGLGQPSSDPGAWRPSKAALSKEPGLSLLGETAEQHKTPETERRDTAESREDDAAAWRPSKVGEERLSSLSSPEARPRFAMPRGLRPLLTALFFAAAAYCFLKLWLSPQAGQLHPALAVAAGVLILLVGLALAGAIARRRRKRGDEKSTLRL